jgi:hypothetical protein
MFLRWRKKELKIQKRDIRRSGRTCGFVDLTKFDKEGLKLLTKLRNDVVVVPRYALILELVELYRDRSGKWRQKTFYLASIREKHLKDILICEGFWLKIDKKLQERKLLSTVESAIREKIDSRVPRPSKLQVQDEINRLEELCRPYNRYFNFRRNKR